MNQASIHVLHYMLLRHITRITASAALILIAASCSSTGSRPSGPPTVVAHKEAARALEGKRPMALQWISWDHFGVAEVRNINKTYWISGRQQSRINGDFLKINGRISQIDATGFTFVGDITTKVYHINDGKPFTRSGPQRFLANTRRGYWRLANMNNPFGVTDYVDIFFNINTARQRPADAVL
ncbi:hypothetical protein [Sulfuriroseicoccus oceanibius]|uniref:Uncharacterized protein n=1 Tax=Sulfuriroseicoccus oceanibius TaxID=2707525 RepID=A0A7T7EZL9_9BACT|nr:hypothetical protein [Sulfuriroseicoccus oceanibius]QQL44013.1 hypothetical protein G3M56_008905 [Sulfuriroseicoccus oceanibius]